MLHIYKLFIAEVNRQKSLSNLTNDDIAKMTGYKKSAIDAFMCGVRKSENMAKAIAAVLKIEM